MTLPAPIPPVEVTRIGSPLLLQRMGDGRPAQVLRPRLPDGLHPLLTEIANDVGGRFCPNCTAPIGYRDEPDQHRSGPTLTWYPFAIVTGVLPAPTVACMSCIDPF